MPIYDDVIPITDWTYDGPSQIWSANFAFEPGQMVVFFAQAIEPFLGIPVLLNVGMGGGDDNGTFEPTHEQAQILSSMPFTLVADSPTPLAGGRYGTSYVAMSALVINPNPLIIPPTEIFLSSEPYGSSSPPSYVGALVFPWPYNTFWGFPTDTPYDASFTGNGIGDGGPLTNPSSATIPGFGDIDPAFPPARWYSWAAGFEWEHELIDLPDPTPDISSGFLYGPGSSDGNYPVGSPEDTYLADSSNAMVGMSWPVVSEGGSGYSSADIAPTWTYQAPYSYPPIEFFFRGTVSFFAVGVDTDYAPWDPVIPPDPGEGEGGAGVHHKLHIPHKNYAKELNSVPESNRMAQYTANWTTIEAWANSLRCSGFIPGTPAGGEGGGEGTPDITITPAHAGWKETRLHIPNKTTFSARHIHENYLAFERWARLVCPYCHIPHKEWMATYQDPNQEQVNLLTIERWARDISKCCVEVEGEIPGGGGA